MDCRTPAAWSADSQLCAPLGQRELRELTRYWSTFVKERATLVNRVQKVLESANIKLASVGVPVEQGPTSRSYRVLQ